MGKSNCQKHMGWIQRTAGAGRAAGTADAFHIQHNQQGFSLDKLEAEIRVVWKTQGAVSVQTRIGDFRQNPVDQVIPGFPFFFGSLLHGGGRQGRGYAKTNDSGDVFRSRPAFSLLGSAVDKGADLYALADIQKADSFWSVQLMAAGAEHIDSQLIHVDRKLAKRLNGVCVEQNAVLLRQPADLLYRLDRSDLIVGKHHGDQDRVRPDGLFQLRELYDAPLVHIQIRHLIPVLFQILAGMKYRVMLDFACYNVFSLGRVSFRGRFDGPVVRLRSSRCKIDLFGLCPQNPGDGLAALVNGLFPAGRKVVDTGRIPVIFRKIRQHGLHHLGSRFCSRRIVQINHVLHCLLSYPAGVLRLAFYSRLLAFFQELR